MDIAAQGYSAPGVSTIYNLKSDGRHRYSMDGNTALSIGAYASNCKFYAAYPMTPASGILPWFEQPMTIRESYSSRARTR